jgi:hypothetical protein
MRYQTFELSTNRAQRCPSLSPPRALWLEFEAPEETHLRNVEIKISNARSNGLPVEALVEEHRRIYQSWIDRLDREIRDLPRGSDPEKLTKQRERATRQYTSAYPTARQMQ